MTQLSFWEGTKRARASYLPSQESLPFVSEVILPGRGDPSAEWLDYFLRACALNPTRRTPTLTECQAYWDKGLDWSQAAHLFSESCKGA